MKTKKEKEALLDEGARIILLGATSLKATATYLLILLFAFLIDLRTIVEALMAINAIILIVCLIRYFRWKKRILN